MSTLAVLNACPTRYRRAAVRHTCDLDATCHTGSTVQTARIRNLSTGGLSLELPTLPERVPFLKVLVSNLAGTVSLTLHVRVLYALPRGTGCIVGGSFPEKLAAGDLEVLLS